MKAILKRPYIAVTIMGAAICAVLLSLSMPKDTGEKQEEQLAVSETAVPPETPKVPEKSKTPQKESVPEIATTQKPEVTVPKKTEVKTEEAISVGVFGEEKTLKMAKPIEGEMLKLFSNGKPVKSKTMGDWRTHDGIDIRAEQGKEIKAVADGEVIRAEMDALTGATISIDHGNGYTSTVYNLENTDKVAMGQKVKLGDVIGTAGNTAKIEMLEDAHVHFEVQKDGKYINPESLF